MATIDFFPFTALDHIELVPYLELDQHVFMYTRAPQRIARFKHSSSWRRRFGDLVAIEYLNYGTAGSIQR